MIPSWRWFGPGDPVTLREIRQAGAVGVVTALHHVPCGEPWSESEISKRKREVEWDAERGRPTGLSWAVVESVPVHEDIKTRSGDWRGRVETYKGNLRRLAAAGVRTVCFNFMPVLDWTRTGLERELPDGSKVLDFDADALAAFDLFLLRRPGAERDYSPAEREAAAAAWARLDEPARAALRDSVLLGLPGTVDGLDPAELLRRLARYEGLGAERLRENLHGFLRELSPLLEELDMRMAIHPDDPPRPLLGLPRIMSTPSDVERLFGEVPSPRVGLTLCTGSFGGRLDNDPATMLERYAPRVFFVHFRNVAHEPGRPGSFHESNHLEGFVEMARAMKALVLEEERRRKEGRADCRIPVRPDHGKLMDGDLGARHYPGYSRMGRMVGLSELRGLEHGLRYSLGLSPG